MNLKVWYITCGQDRDMRYLALHRAELWTVALLRATMFLDEGEALAVVQKYPEAKLHSHEVKPLPTPHSIDESFANIVELLETLRERARGISADNVDLGGRLGKAERERDVLKASGRDVARQTHQLEKENESLRKQRDDFFGAYNDIRDRLGLRKIPSSYRHLAPEVRQETYRTVVRHVEIREQKEGLRAKVRRLEREAQDQQRHKEDLLNAVASLERENARLNESVSVLVKDNAKLAQSAVQVVITETKRDPDGAQPEPPAVPEPLAVSAPRSVQDVLHFLRTGGRYFSGATCADVLERKGIISRLDTLK